MTTTSVSLSSTTIQRQIAASRSTANLSSSSSSISTLATATASSSALAMNSSSPAIVQLNSSTCTDITNYLRQTGMDTITAVTRVSNPGPFFQSRIRDLNPLLTRG